LTRRRFSVALLLAAALCLDHAIAGHEGGDRLEGVERVSGNIFRGSQPDLSAFPRIAALGIRTVVSLRAEEDGEDERAAAIAAGLNFVRIGLRRLGRPEDEEIRRVLETITDEENQPVLVHCRRGADRTGVIVACYRIGYEGWSAEAALAEAREHGLGWWQLGMKQFIRDSCGEGLPGAGPGEGD
jgi:protein tyrosine/serine phosphatase